MSSKLTLARLLATALALGLAAPAIAQELPANVLEQRARQQVRLPGEAEREEAMLTGEGDIVLTRRARLFSISGTVEASVTDNAFLSEIDAVSDLYVQAQVGIGVGTRIAGRFDVFAEVSALMVRYEEQDSLDYAALSGVVGVRAPAGPLVFTATWQPVIVFDRDFENRQLTSHRLRGSLSWPFRLGNAVLEPSISGERTIADPADYSVWSGGAGLSLTAPLPVNSPMLIYLGVDYQRRDFDAYFPGLVGLNRKDDALSVSAGLVWRPVMWGEARLGWSYQNNRSNSDVNRWEAHSGRLGLFARFRF
jgi:hypothetical protein